MPSPVRIEDTEVDLGGGRVFVRQWSPASAISDTPVVLLHDSLGCVELWRDFPAALAARLGRRVLAYDRAGFGRSSSRSDPPSLDFILDEARDRFPALRDALGLERYGLLGHSVGGAIAVVIAALDPGRCAFVVTESAQAFVEARTLDGIRSARSQFEQSAAFARLARWHGDKARWVLDAWTQAWLHPAFADWSLDPWLPRVRCPVLAIHGDRDEYGSTAFPRRIAEGVAGPAEQQVLDDCGHVPHREQPERVLQRIDAFVASVSSGQAATLHGSCHCADLTAELSTRIAPSGFHPRACDCSFCRKHGASWISDPAGRLRITARGSTLQSYRQGSDQARFLVCGRCGVLVAVVVEHDGRMSGALNAGCLDAPPAFGATVAASPQLLDADAKRARWRELWVADVELVVTP